MEASLNENISIVQSFETLGSISSKELLVLGKNRYEEVVYNKYDPFCDFRTSTLDISSTLTKNLLENSSNAISKDLLIELSSYDERLIIKHQQLEKASKSGSFFKDLEINAPNEWVVSKGKTLIGWLTSLNVFDYVILPSADEGVTFKFRNNNRNLYVEIYNDKQIGYIIEDCLKKRIISNQDLFEVNSAVLVIKKFLC